VLGGWPWRHTIEPPPNAADFAQFALRWEKLDRYFVGQLGPDLFLIGGMLDDWVYGELGVPNFLREVLDPYYTVDPPAAITYGMALGPSQLRAVTLIRGSLEYEPGPGTILPAGEHLLRATFTPKDALRYTTKVMEVTLMVEPAPLTLRPLDQARP